MNFTRCFARGARRKVEGDNISLHTLAKLTGVPRTSLRRLLVARGGVTLETASKVAEALDSTIDGLAIAGLQGGDDDDE